MSAGTLTLTNNSAAVTGSGTAFTTELAVGDFIVVTVGGIPYTLAIKTVNSNTSLTLVSNYTGPTQGGAAWYAVPRVAMNLVTAALVAQSAEALRGLNYDKQNWQRLFNASGNITVTLPDGSSFTGPSWQYMVNTVATKTNGAVPVNQGGTGATTAEGSRTNLGLGDMATKSSGETEGAGMTVGAFGIGRPSGIKITNETGTPGLVTALSGYGFIPFRNEQNITGRIAASSPALWVRTGGTFAFLSIPYVSSAPVRISGGLISNGTIDYTRTLYDDLNTTKASDGTLKAASPVVKLFADGSFETNDESEGCTVTRMKAGEYLIEGCMGMNSDAAWGGIDGGFDIPKDRNGQALIWLDYEVNADGSVLVKTFHREYPTAPAFARNSVEGYVDGQPADIPADQFVSVRVEMPQNSIWNQRQKEAVEPAS
ncbi:phage tail protein [Enterobacter hormaechei]|nr:phage tail protein [Enterobacter hormaechei]